MRTEKPFPLSMGIRFATIEQPIVVARNSFRTVNRYELFVAPGGSSVRWLGLGNSACTRTFLLSGRG